MSSMVKRYARRAPGVYRGFQKRQKVYVPAVKQLASDVLYLKGLINSEPKFYAHTANNNVGYNGTVISLCDIPQGDSSQSRDGNRVLPRYFGFKGRFHISPISSVTHLGLRVIIFRWWGSDPNSAGAAPATDDILSSSLVGTQNVVDSFLSSDITGSRGDRNRRIEVLKNYEVVLDANGNSSLQVDENITVNGGKGPKEHIEYFSAATAPPTSGGFYVLICSDSATATDLSYHFNSKVTFYDN